MSHDVSPFRSTVEAVRARNEARTTEQLELPVERKTRRRRGHRTTDTSIAAGEKHRTYTEELRERLHQVIRGAAGGLTADEAAEAIGEATDLKALMAVRRRVSDIAKLGLIVETQLRRENADGNTQIVWRAALQVGHGG